MSHLDQRKDEAIERTFKQVSREFATIFEKLVPAGHGRLVIQRRTGRRDAAESDEEQGGAVENYTGVGISVSFNSKDMDEQQRIQQLSGGQKSESNFIPSAPCPRNEASFTSRPCLANLTQVFARSASSSPCSRRRAARW